MGTVDNTTAHYEAVIADLIAERDRLRAEADEAQRAWKAKQQSVSDADHLVERMKARLSEKQGRSVVVQPNAIGEVADYLAGLSIADACMELLRRAARPMTNREIHEGLEMRGYKVNSDNPTNNINSCLSHRAGSRGDVARDGKAWHIPKKKEELSGAELNGVTHEYVEVVPILTQ
ncbi:MAG: hypothetical protein JSS20_06670 [Proteobacteria bacterium]|nr:hypothetical protein [Pseudomonadota bacterium]